jgi:uncharacterized protein YaiL (DUF2058 family)
MQPKERSGGYTETYGTGSYGTTGLGTSTYSNTGLSYGSGYQTSLPQVTQLPTTLEKKERPAVVHETVLPEERVEIQPVIHRERELLEVHQIVQPMVEKGFVPTEIRAVTLPSESKAELRESTDEFQRRYNEELVRHKSFVNVQPVKKERLEKPAIVEEVIRKKVIEEVQPVIHREIVTPVIIQQTLPIYEKIVEAPRFFLDEQKSVIDLGTKQFQAQQYSSSFGTSGLGTQQYSTASTGLAAQQYSPSGLGTQQYSSGLETQPYSSGLGAQQYATGATASFNQPYASRIAS